MADHEPNDDPLRHAFESFRAEALDDAALSGPDAVRAAARHRQRVRMAMSGAAAVVVLVVGTGVGLVATHTPPVGAPRTQSAASASASHHDRSSGQPSPRGSGTYRGTPSHGDSDHGRPAAPGWRVAVDAAPAVVLTSDDGKYAGTVDVTITNTGDRSIPNATVELTVPAPMTFTGEGDANSCDQLDPCVIGTATDLAPGERVTVRGTLAYPEGNRPMSRVTGTVRVVATDSDSNDVGSDTADLPVEVEPTSSGSPSPSTGPKTPSSTPAPSSGTG